MHRLRIYLFSTALLLVAASSALAAHPWETLPPTPTLPTPEQSGTAPVNGIQLWYAVFGQGSPVILLHGGLGNSNYWGDLVPALTKHGYKVIVVDSRGQGRSTITTAPITYNLMASDVVGLMDYLHIQKAALVGWSDGAVIGLEIAIHHPDRLTKLFAFGGNSDPSGVKDISKSPAFTAYLARVKTEYEKLSPTPTKYQTLLDDINQLWMSVDISYQELHSITVPTWIVVADHGAIKLSNADYMFSQIPGAEMLVLPGVSHFAFLQNPEEFNAAVLRFLAWKP